MSIKIKLLLLYILLGFISLMIYLSVFFADKPLIIQKEKPTLPSGTKLEVIDGHEYLTSESWTLLGGWNVSSRTHKVDCKLCKVKEVKRIKSSRD